MSGVKGLSGRKSKRDEEKRLRVIERAWDVIDQYLNDPSISRINKVDIASKLVTKDMPTELTGALEHNHFFAEVFRRYESSPSRISEYVGNTN